MKNLNYRKTLRIIGIIGSLACILIFINKPSFPTPDKLLVFLAFAGLSLSQAKELLKRLLPFVALLIVYESFRGLAHSINNHVNYTFMAKFDERLFGSLPTAALQRHLWHGSVQWYDFVLYITYMLHFVMPLALAIIIWKMRDKYYWQFMYSYVVLSFAGFVTYFIYPAAPPWMASDKKLIEPITRVSSHVWAALGVNDFPSLYNKIAPNPVAAVPSLHCAYATLFAVIVFKLFGKKWGALSSIYPLLMCFGVVYQGEHYVFDVILGIIFAFSAFYIIEFIFALKSKIIQFKETEQLSTNESSPDYV